MRKIRAALARTTNHKCPQKAQTTDNFEICNRVFFCPETSRQRTECKIQTVRKCDCTPRNASLLKTLLATHSRGRAPTVDLLLESHCACQNIHTVASTGGDIFGNKGLQRQRFTQRSAEETKIRCVHCNEDTKIRCVHCKPYWTNKPTPSAKCWQRGESDS